MNVDIFSRIESDIKNLKVTPKYNNYKDLNLVNLLNLMISI